MKHDTPWMQELPGDENVKQMVGQMVRGLSEEPEEPALEAQPEPAEESTSKSKSKGRGKRGRPPRLCMEHLALSILWCFFNGWHAQLELWRFLCLERIGRFGPVHLSDQAVYKRLANGGALAMQCLCAQVSAFIAGTLAPLEDRSLAPSFGQILALDESKLDAMKRWVSELRGLPNGDPALLPGRLSMLYDVRRQCVRRLDLLWDASQHCSVHAREMISGLAPGTLLLFDLGYYGFEWLDELTLKGLSWVGRIKSNSSYTIQHFLIQRDGYWEAIVQLGAYRSDRAACSVRLICIRYQGAWYRYLTNVRDPRALSGAEVARLYGRRWDIELAFRLLKDYLNLRVLWSAKREVIAVQVWATVILAQLCTCYQVQVAAQAEVEVFDVSLDLLIRHTPRLLSQGLDPVAEVARVGRMVGIIRPSTRIQREVPTFRAHEYDLPPDDLPWFREPRYDHRPAGNRNRAKKPANKPAA